MHIEMRVKDVRKREGYGTLERSKTPKTENRDYNVYAVVGVSWTIGT